MFSKLGRECSYDNGMNSFVGAPNKEKWMIHLNLRCNTSKPGFITWHSKVTVYWHEMLKETDLQYRKYNRANFLVGNFNWECTQSLQRYNLSQALAVSSLWKHLKRLQIFMKRTRSPLPLNSLNTIIRKRLQHILWYNSWKILYCSLDINWLSYFMQTMRYRQVYSIGYLLMY